MIALLPVLAYSQEGITSESSKPRTGFDWSRAFISPYPILGFGTGILNLGLQAEMGYYVLDELALGINLQYIYSQITYVDVITNARFREKFSMYGGSLFARYSLTESIFLQAEYELLNIGAIFCNAQGECYRGRVTVPGIYLGAGYRQVLGKNSWSISLMYNFIYDPLLSPYPLNPYPKIGFTFGL